MKADGLAHITRAPSPGCQLVAHQGCSVPHALVLL